MARQPRKITKREQLIDVAVRLFAEQGYSAVRLKEVAEATNNTYSLVYYYFKDKEELFAASMSAAVEKTISHYKSINRSSEDPVARIVEWFQLNVLYATELRFFVRIMIDAPELKTKSVQMARVIDSFYKFEQTILQSSFRVGVAQKIFVCPDPDDLARFTSCHIDGIYMRSLSRADFEVADAFRDLYTYLMKILEYGPSDVPDFGKAGAFEHLLVSAETLHR
ncbi:MAG: TetR/AcrR family transcriptional regulator [Pseudomonadota bacterium]